MTQTKLLLVLRPFGFEFEGLFPPTMMPVMPFYTTVSRLEYKPEAFDCKLICPPIKEVLAQPNHKMTWAEVCDKRAMELLKIEGPIFLTWSGGIDSTCVAVAILRNWPKEDLKRVTVLCNKESINENKNFLPIIAKNFKVENMSHRIEDFLKRGHVITGELGDQCFGSDIVGDCITHWGEGVIKQSYKEVVPKIFEVFSPSHGKGTYENYSNIVNECPFEIKTTHDFLWWLNYTQKYQHVKLRMLMNDVWTDAKTYFPKIVHFFDSLDFNVWSIHNHDKKIGNTWESYKWVSKEYIVDYSKDETYLKKLKVNSLINLYVGLSRESINWSIDENWNFLSKEETLARMKK
jgi:hypothetical protein